MICVLDHTICCMSRGFTQYVVVFFVFVKMVYGLGIVPPENNLTFFHFILDIVMCVYYFVIKQGETLTTKKGVAMGEKKYKWNSPNEWLNDKIDSYDPHELRLIAKTLATRLDADEVQDEFQSDMDEDGYFDELKESS